MEKAVTLSLETVFCLKTVFWDGFLLRGLESVVLGRVCKTDSEKNARVSVTLKCLWSVNLASALFTWVVFSSSVSVNIHDYYYYYYYYFWHGYYPCRIFIRSVVHLPWKCLGLGLINITRRRKRGPESFDTVGWVTGRASGL